MRRPSDGGDTPDRRPGERPPRAARSGGSASWSGCRRGPSILEAADVGLGDHAGAERGAQIVEAKTAQGGPVKRSLVAAAERRTVERYRPRWRTQGRPRRSSSRGGRAGRERARRREPTAQREPSRTSGQRAASPRRPANVTPVRPMLAGVPRRASSSTSRSQASAVHFVKYPVDGRPRSVQAGPSFFWTSDRRRACTSRTRPVAARPHGERRFRSVSQPTCSHANRKPSSRQIGDKVRSSGRVVRTKNPLLPSNFLMPPVGLEPTTVGVKVARLQATCRRYGQFRASVSS
jgi:hypothetical protein